MARPTSETKNETLYRCRSNGGKYRVVYMAKAGISIGVPTSTYTDLLTLEKAGGSTKAPAVIFTSDADFRANFEIVVTVADAEESKDENIW